MATWRYTFQNTTVFGDSNSLKYLTNSSHTYAPVTFRGGRFCLPRFHTLPLFLPWILAVIAPALTISHLLPWAVVRHARMQACASGHLPPPSSSAAKTLGCPLHAIDQGVSEKAPIIGLCLTRSTRGIYDAAAASSPPQ